MTELLKKMLINQLENPIMRKHGSETLVGMLDLHSVLHSVDDEGDIIEGIIEMATWHAQRVNRTEKSFSASILFTLWNETDNEVLTEDIEHHIHQTCESPSGYMPLCVLEPDIETLLLYAPKGMNINHLFFFWFSWDKDKSFSPMIEVIPLGRFLTESLVKKVSWEQHIQSVDGMPAFHRI